MCALDTMPRLMRLLQQFRAVINLADGDGAACVCANAMTSIRTCHTSYRAKLHISILWGGGGW